MLRVIGHRLLVSIPLLFIVTFAVFGLESLIPGNAAQTILGENATPAAVAQLNTQMGLNDPFFERYAHWVGHAVTGNFGSSVISGAPVWTSVVTRLGVTMSLLIPSLVLAAVAGVVLGMASAVRGGWLARLIDVVSLLGFALPSFWVGLILVSIFAVKLGVLPATGYTPLGTSPSEWIASITLPVVALSLYGITAIAKQTRDSASEVLDSDYIRFLRANGVPERSVLLKHVLRNSSIPVATSLGLISIGALGGTVFIENVFVLPGLGSLATQATLDHDIPVILGVALCFTLAVIAINLVIDLIYGLLNPKVRVS
ncbi:ABC transporter permease [Flexivirga endophytica]|uniref:ABC transporter permease n=1 Tax=Flexivirga endophytica TaxID=1849103 RepID=A0A916T1P7_9MICO|nr:ABC transporter permease [Flexivirga endophytica]GGB24563.1 ABC transporter permease [Flexivirga endophytica]GHB63267.1 ABC transporter permease [Flexivirga endophytica]